MSDDYEPRRYPPPVEREPPWNCMTLEDYVPERLRAAAARILDPLREQPGKPVRLHVTTAGAPVVVKCDGSYTCSCEKCVGEREARLRLGVGRRPPPWQPRPARQRRSGGVP